MRISPRRLSRNLLILLFLLETLAFCNYYQREIAGDVPTAYDQCTYLQLAYQIQDQVRQHGLPAFFPAAWDAAANFPTGCAIQMEGALAAILLGGTRFPSLAVNLISFLALQLYAFDTARKMGKSSAFGYFLIGLILCQHTAWFWAGGLFDFRIDFLAYCLYGMWTCAVIRSEMFLNRRKCISIVALAAILVLNRYLTLLYFFGVCGIWAVVLGLVWAIGGGDRSVRQRLTNLVLALGAIVLIVAPVLWAVRSAIHDYYVVGHVTGPEKYIRLQEWGIHNAIDFLLFYPRSILFDHLGLVFIAAGIFMLAAGGIIRLIVLRSRRTAGPPDRDSRWPRTVFLLISIAVPLAALTADISKSPVVGGIVDVPIALLLVGFMADAVPLKRSTRANRMLVATAAIVLILGAGNFLDQANRAQPLDIYRADVQRDADMAVWMTQFSVDQHWTEPRVSADLISSDFCVDALTCVGYERLGELVHFKSLLAGTIFKVDKTQALSDLADSNFVILTTTPKVGVFPFYDGIDQYENDLVAWSEQHMLAARTFELRGDRVTLYVRATATVVGVSGDWITSGGIDVLVPGGALKKFPIIHLHSGNESLQYLHGPPVVTAVAQQDGASYPLPTKSKFTDSDYDIQIDASSVKPSDSPCRIHLSFDRYWVPLDVHMNADTRHLVIRGPSDVSLLRHEF